MLRILVHLNEGIDVKIYGLKRWILLGAVISTLLFYLIGNIIVYKNSAVDQHEYSTKLLKQADTVTDQIVSSFHLADHLKVTSCSSDNIQKLRYIVSGSRYVEDIGFLENGVMVCTANQGLLKEKVQLPPPNFETPKKYKFYSNIKNRVFSKDVIDITQSGNIAVITSDSIFGQFSYFPPSFNYKLASSDGMHIFQDSKNTIEYSKFKSLLPHKIVSTKICSTKYFYCVFTNKPFTGIFFINDTLLAALTLFFSVIGGLVSYIIFFKKHKSKTIEYRLMRAVKDKKLYLEYQPIVLSKTKEIIGFEVLVRWKDHVYGQVSPELFINISEENYFYDKVSVFIIDTALQELKDILSENRNLYLSININNFEINNPKFISKLSQQVKSHHILTRQIKLEITEKINESFTCINLFSKKAKEEGFVISLDDFGTGVSNIQWLSEIDFDEIKLDKLFINGLFDDKNKLFFISLLNAISKLNKKIVFEGVESEDEYKYIYEHNSSNLIQGWYFYKSLPVAEIKKLF